MDQEILVRFPAIASNLFKEKLKERKREKFSDLLCPVLIPRTSN